MFHQVVPRLYLVVLTEVVNVPFYDCSRSVTSDNLDTDYPFNFQHHTANSPFLFSHITYSRDGENLLIYQRKSCWVIMSFIIRTSLTEKALALAKRNLSLIAIGPVYFPMVKAPLKRTLISLVPLNRQLIDADQITEPSDKLDNTFLSIGVWISSNRDTRKTLSTK